MVINIEIEDYYKCPRCNCDSLNGMTPCSRGNCEAKIVGTVRTTTEVVNKINNEQHQWNKENSR